MTYDLKSFADCFDSHFKDTEGSQKYADQTNPYGRYDVSHPAEVTPEHT